MLQIAAMANPYPEVVALNTRVFAAGLKIGDVLTRANLSRNTWAGWKRGVAPNLGNVRKVSDAIDSLIAEKEDPNGGQGRLTDAQSGAPE